MPRDILILGLDTFAAKNVSQVRLLEAEGFAFTVATNDMRGSSRTIFDAQGFRRSRLVVLGGLLHKVFVAMKLLVRRRFHHVEFYPAGRLSLVYLLLIKLFGHRLLVIERGDIGLLPFYDALTRLNLRLAYRFADRIAYKETYMKPALEGLTGAPLSFVPNSVDERPAESVATRPIDFLWANRIIPQRRPEWVIEAMSDPRLAGQSLTVLGVEVGTLLDRFQPERQRRLRTTEAANVTIEGFVDPEPLYRQARFFCLPAEIVFGNNALLEAMAWGVVPIVTMAPGVELLVEDAVNGIVTPLDEQAYRDAMVRAAKMPFRQWEEMSAKALETVRDRFSASQWKNRMMQAYAEFDTA